MTTIANTTSTSNVMPREFTPKRGIPSKTMEIAEGSFEFKPHHQKTLILELLADGSMTLEAMVKKVEESDELKARLKSKQSVFNCITYHMKDLAKIGKITVK